MLLSRARNSTHQVSRSLRGTQQDCSHRLLPRPQMKTVAHFHLETSRPPDYRLSPGPTRNAIFSRPVSTLRVRRCLGCGQMGSTLMGPLQKQWTLKDRGKKVRPGTLGKIKVGLMRVITQEVPLSKNMKSALPHECWPHLSLSERLSRPRRRAAPARACRPPPFGRFISQHGDMQYIVL